jgi:hypothetical protein
MAGSEDTRMIIAPGEQAGRSFGAAKTDRHSSADRSRSAAETHLHALSVLNDKATHQRRSQGTSSFSEELSTGIKPVDPG